jgi:recombination protein RecT
MSTTAIAPKQQTLKDYLERSRESIARVLPKHLDADRIIKLALVAYTKDSKLSGCTMSSVLQSVMTASQLGLEFGPMGECHLVAYGDKCQIIIGWQGLVRLAMQSGRVKSISARVVHEKDQFEYGFGLKPTLEHKPSRDADPGPLTHVYAVAHMADGETQFEVMTRAEVEAIKAKSKSAKNGPWSDSSEPEMWRKTAVRRARQRRLRTRERDRREHRARGRRAEGEDHEGGSG